MEEVYIVSAQRTPLGSFGGCLAALSAIDLGVHATQSCLNNTHFGLDLIEEVLFGSVCSANLGQAPARQVSVRSGLSPNVCSTTINKVCASGMKALTIGAQEIQMGHRDFVLVGGMESMTNVPYYLTKMRWGNKYGNHEVIDGLHKDGLQDVYDQQAMGVFADRTAEKYQIDRDEQDQYTMSSYRAADKAWKGGLFKAEVSPIVVDIGKGKTMTIAEDEEYTKVDFNKIPTLKAAFTKEGTITAANSSKISDGASALLLVSGKKVKELNLKPLARLVAYADAEQEPQWFTTSPTLAASRALKRAGLSLNDIDVFEVNEAFAVVVLAFIKILGIAPEMINIQGGAVSLGHPLGASGARICTTLTHILSRSTYRYGMAAICNGGGGATAVILEKC